MILIISQSDYEYTTDIVYDWTKHLGGDVKRLNGSDLLENSFKIEYNADGKSGIFLKDIDFNNINVIWYRRWMNMDFKYNDVRDDYNSYIQDEFTKGCTKYFFHLLNEKKWNVRHNVLKPYPSKIEQIDFAKKNGFKIPETIICNTKSELSQFLSKHIRVINKPIYEIGSFYEDETLNLTYTTLIDEEKLDYIDDFFYPSLFQQEIKKKFELRIFYYKGDIYSMAIVSSTNEQTSIDFRVYDFDNPNRTIPFKLNEDEKNMIKNLMRDLDLDTGSLDVIYSYDGEFYFLEVNPLGQFGMVSVPCNYYIEKKIAKTLINEDK